ncbi:hypothetical protein CDAR_521891 [Caerostris darwini]|uniref:Sperm-lysin n=1 Tax=Caerostris darwini TaxID=1538125 RepID=A0AAV4P199_9ARAC|nr:hypothetical protein CDAR_521891 [Caerostris darwini]
MDKSPVDVGRHITLPEATFDDFPFSIKRDVTRDQHRGLIFRRHDVQRVFNVTTRRKLHRPDIINLSYLTASIRVLKKKLEHNHVGKHITLPEATFDGFPSSIKWNVTRDQHMSLIFQRHDVQRVFNVTTRRELRRPDITNLSYQTASIRALRKKKWEHNR